MKAALNQHELKLVAEATFRKTADIGFRHAQENVPYMKRSLLDVPRPAGKGRSAIAMSAGPSLHRRRTIERIKASSYCGVGTLVVADGALGYCLRHGVVPDYVVTVDPHPSWIIRWFGDPELKSRPDDDYFRRQDLDPALNTREIERNEELIELVNRYGPQINVIIATCVAPNVTRRCLDAGMPLYWWNPICDDYDDPHGHTRKLHALTGMPCMVTGGNCGASAWIFANGILEGDPVALVGMDLGYAPGTALRRTQYYHELIKFYSEEQLEAEYVQLHNPHLNETWFTDPTYYWYRQCLMDVVAQSGWTLINCTEGGTVFGDGVVWQGLDVFIAEQMRSRRPAALAAAR
ncbi:MAG TPA: 6-hydroxymethylpterin diphosphokinase MptE-like protein [Nitrospirales bacterium]|nr:6-hydroxymethylpterin diphosphokinase MptE-like protein [Nitrospirales bacterium]